MSRDSPQDLPPALREAFERERSEASPSEDAPDLDTLWSLLESAKPPASALPDASETWSGVRRHIEDDAGSSAEAEQTVSSQSRRPARSSSHRRVGWRVGATVAVLLIAALGAWLWYRPVAVTATPGTSLTHTLPDGSTVELNGGTRLTYSRTMSTVAPLEDARRTVEVRGEAYFEVRAGERPFVVRTQTAQVEVVGTAFAVRTDSGDADTHVALAEGTVQVRGQAAPERVVTLRPGEAVRVGREGPMGPPADTSIRRVTAWRRGGFAVTAQPLPAIVQALEQQFGTSIRLSPAIPEEVTSSPLTLYYSQNVDVETVLHDLSMARRLSYRSTANGYVLGPANDTWSSSGSSK